MTQVAVARGNVASTNTTAGNRGSNLVELNWRDMLDLANELSTVDGFVPKALLGRPPAILATLMSGAELGLGPMASLRAIYIIDGKATLSAEAARALVYAAGHAMEVESSDQRCVARGRRRDETKWTEVEWTIDRARRAKLADRQAWRLYPRAMLTARATAELAHLKFADVLAGLDILEAVAEDAVADEEPPKTNRRRRSINTPQATDEPLGAALPSSETVAPLPTAEPPQLPGESVLRDAVSDVPEMATATSSGSTDEPPLEPELTPVADMDQHRGLAQTQLRRLHARMAEVFPDADRLTMDRLRHALVIIVTRHRDDGAVRSSSELTTAELMSYEARLNWIAQGRCIVGERPDGVVEFHMDGNVYAVNTDTLEVTSS